MRRQNIESPRARSPVSHLLAMLVQKCHQVSPDSANAKEGELDKRVSLSGSGLFRNFPHEFVFFVLPPKRLHCESDSIVTCLAFYLFPPDSNQISVVRRVPHTLKSCLLAIPPQPPRVSPTEWQWRQ